MFLTRFTMLPFSNSRPLDFCASIIWKASSITTGMNLTAVTKAKTMSRGTLVHFIICSSSSGDVVTKKTPRSRVSFQYADESDRKAYPIPKSVHIEGGRQSDGDRHALLIDKDACRLYELYALYPKPGGGWKAGSGAIWNLTSNALRPVGWTSADAAGLPIFPGLARYDEAARGVIDHALRFTASRTRRAYVYPARHYASSSDDPSLPPMGLRVRLKASVDISGFPKQTRIVLQALKTYGMILADNGSSWYVSGAPNPKWSNDDLHSIGRVTGSDFEVVDTSSLPHPGA